MGGGGGEPNSLTVTHSIIFSKVFICDYLAYTYFASILMGFKKLQELP